jgi:hypothetical protein
MKTLAIVFSFIFLVLPFRGHSVSQYKPGDRLYVHALDGLVLRASASPRGTKVMSLSYGAVITVMADNMRQVAHRVEFFGGYVVRGYWVRVQVGKNQHGYVFDGYLSSYQVPSVLPNGDDPNDPEGDMSLQERYLLLHSARRGRRVDLDKYETTYQHYKQVYVNGDEAELYGGEGGSQHHIRFHKGISLEEGYLISRALWLENLSLPYTVVYSRGVIKMTTKDGMFEVEVNSNTGGVEIIMRHAD